ncbi:conserved hypothetical protein [Gloeothece citriformis PCC 7424]|uniref:Addiction module component n=1 Tax=Gloeothece citriformis (strain PCC 7424) TaxID=65393 RepID=B7KJ42_GLOC7|nr:hypothetical protein [Gloeothece citriformis]ACK72126.1 conserved hypothetical protein [Gloeothece citriformis PCC 7424]
MTTLQQIEMAIKQLPESEIRKLLTWLQTYVDDRWDQQIKADLESGKLDNLISKVEADIAANQVRDLNEVLDNP